MSRLRYIDLFSGIGGFRLALDALGMECVFSAEVDRHAVEVYKENFGDDSYCDVTKLDAKTIPDFDILCAGFPCQAFSICGKQEGFADKARGTLFFDIVRILKEKSPSAFILENVKNLERHDGGNTMRVMLDLLTEIGYTVSYKVLNAKDFGVPQSRERIILVGSNMGNQFDFMSLKRKEVRSMKSFLDKGSDFEVVDSSGYTLLEGGVL